ncbi:MAG: DUF2461 domain-containing protein [Actinobacteria bacterium]|nr:DUF2461 domain-containing protein [Actinomycetota bacterium]
MGFRGFPDAAFQFYEQLMADNSRTFWQANLATYRSAVREPMEALLAELADHGPFHVFRPNRDVRFSKDKRPYKEGIGAVGESEGGSTFYVHLSAAGMMAGSGYYHMASDQLDRFRRAVDAQATGAEIAEICASIARRGLRLGAMDELKTAPRGYAKDHPRIELLRRKGLVATREWPEARWMRTSAVVTRVREAWDAGAPMNEWLDTHVGPSTLAPSEEELERMGRR